MVAASVLIVEDEPQLRDVLVRSLRAEGFDAAGVGTAHELIPSIEDAPDLLVIDIGLPDADGRDVCQALRARGIGTPVLFLTARDALTDRLAGFSAGGDDYVTKPFDIEEVTARLQALLRRSGGDAPVSSAGLMFDPAERSVAQDGARVALTPTEFRVLTALAARQGRACARPSWSGRRGLMARSCTTTPSMSTSRGCAGSSARCPGRRGLSPCTGPATASNTNDVEARSA